MWGCARCTRCSTLAITWRSDGNPASWRIGAFLGPVSGAPFATASDEFLEAENMGFTIRLPANNALKSRIGYLLKRPVGRPPQQVRRYYASFAYRVAVPQQMFVDILSLIARLRAPPAPA